MTLDTAVLRSSSGKATVKAHLEGHGGGVGNLHVLGSMVKRSAANMVKDAVAAAPNVYTV